MVHFPLFGVTMISMAVSIDNKNNVTVLNDVPSYTHTNISTIYLLSTNYLHMWYAATWGTGTLLRPAATGALGPRKCQNLCIDN